MYVSSPAIVLNRLKHNDNTIITTLYTQQMGSITFAVKIPKTSKAQLKPTLIQPLNQLHIEWNHRPNTPIQRPKNLHLLQPYNSLLSLPPKTTLATFLAETLYNAIRQEKQGDLHPFIAQSLLWLDLKPSDYHNFPIVFLLHLACLLGFTPKLDNPHHFPYFDLLNAEYTPSLPQHNFYLHHQDAQYIPLFMRLNYSTMHLLHLTPDQRQRSLRIITTYLRLHIPDFPQLNSLNLLSQI